MFLLQFICFVFIFVFYFFPIFFSINKERKITLKFIIRPNIFSNYLKYLIIFI